MKVLDHFRRFMAEETDGEAAPTGDDMVAKAKPKGNKIETLYDRLHIQKRSFDEELAAMIENPPHGSVLMTITPDMAKEMLRYNEPNDEYRNRPFYQSTCDKYTRAIIDGEWTLTGNPVQFSDAGRMIDGQHRLKAIIAANQPVDLYVVFGIPHRSFANIDRLRKRTAADIFTINGVPNAKAMAAAINFVACYDLANFWGKATSMRPNSGKRLSEPQLYEYYKRHTGLQDGMRFYTRCQRTKLGQPAPILALWYICARKSRKDADAFFEILTTGAGAFNKYDPALCVRNRLYKAAVEQGTIGINFTALLILTGWNLYRTNRTARYWKIDPNGRVPRAI